ncbi:MAG TPA: hypothetical protein VLS89_16120, partial [Candidatus Nanopelagicales bacterium]|nr:hypothetical protein [Candidatus Nanopelagicales bacterium]
DFNAHPFDEEIALRTCLWATREKAELGDERDLIPPGFEPAMDVVHQGVRHAAQGSLGGVETLRRIKPLYNPMWRWLPERDGHPRGTYYRKHDDSVVTWQCTDQILVSPDLAPRIDRIDILDRMGAEVLVQPDRVMMNKSYGDHLPVELTLEDGRRQT